MAVLILTVIFSFLVGGSVLAQGSEKARERNELREEKQEGVCNRIEVAWEARFKGYERAKEVRKTAFERTQERWEKLFDKLEEMGIGTSVVRADAVEVRTKFEALIKADDEMLVAMKTVAVAACAGEGQVSAKEALGVAQRARRSARTAYNASLKKLHTDLSGLRRSIKSEED